VWLADCRTAPTYRMHRVEQPLRPGLVRVASDGRAFPGELWRLPMGGFGQLTAAVTAPLAIGTMALDDGRLVKGFLCEPAGAGPDISAHDGWRAYLAAR
jgi:allophanate hydrolase